MERNRLSRLEFHSSSPTLTLTTNLMKTVSTSKMTHWSSESLHLTTNHGWNVPYGCVLAVLRQDTDYNNINVFLHTEIKGSYIILCMIVQIFLANISFLSHANTLWDWQY